MWKIRLNKGEEFEVTEDGVQALDNILTINLFANEKNIVEFKELFENTENTKKIQLIDHDGSTFLSQFGCTKIAKYKKADGGYCGLHAAEGIGHLL